MRIKRPTRCHLVLYLFLLYRLLNMYRATLCPASGIWCILCLVGVWCACVLAIVGVFLLRGTGYKTARPQDSRRIPLNDSQKTHTNTQHLLQQQQQDTQMTVTHRKEHTQQTQQEQSCSHTSRQRKNNGHYIRTWIPRENKSLPFWEQHRTHPHRPNKYQTHITRKLKQCDLIFPKMQHMHITQKNPSPPTLKAQLKLHKPNIPIRPVVNNRTAPSYKIAKKPNNILKQHLNLDNSYTG